MAANSNQSANAVVEHLRTWNPKAVEDVVEFHGETTIVVPHGLLRAAAQECRDALQFDLLSDVTCADRFPAEPRFELQYHLTSIPRKQKIRLRTRVPGDNPNIESLVSVWPGANWLERELFDLMGVNFIGHPDLRRILLPDDWEGHPLRRDYPVQGFRDIPATYLPGLKK